MNKLSTEQRAAILSALVEGNSIASTCRMLGVNKVTVLRLLADAGTLAEQFHDLTVRDLTTRRAQLDEIWAFCYAKAKNVPADKLGQFGYGDVWTWTAIDADSKLMISWAVGKRDTATAKELTFDLADRLRDRVQITSDGYRPYMDAIYRAFGNDVDHAMLVKLYGPDRSSPIRYSPSECIGCRQEIVCGHPEQKHINTSYVERANLTMRMGMRRFTRLTNGFSKRLENHKFAIALHYFHYNFIRRHMTIKTTPAVMAGVADHEWTMVEFVKMMEREEELLGGRISDYKPASSKKLN